MTVWPILASLIFNINANRDISFLRYGQKGRRMIIGEVYWKEGGLPNHGKDLSPKTVEHIVEASKNAQIKQLTQIKNRAGLETIGQGMLL